MKKWLAWCMTAALTAGLIGCAGRDTVPDAEPGILRVAVPFDMKTMDVAQTTQDYMVPLNVFDRLLEMAPQESGEYQAVPSLCTEYQVSPDGLVYTFTLREGVTFSNGSPLTSGDVHYSFVRLLRQAAANYDVALEIQGAKAVMDGEAAALTGFRELDPLRFSIRLLRPNAGFPAELTGPGLSIVDRETTEKAENFGISCQETVGTGPYKITSWEADSHYVLEYNELYWGKEPSVKKVVVSVIPDATARNLMYQSGELDIIDLEALDAAVVSSTYKDKYAEQLLAGPRMGITYLAMNQDNPYLGDVQVRRAISRAVDVETIIAAVYQGDAIRENGIIPTGIWGHNEQLRPAVWNPEESRKLLREAGYQDGEIHFELAMEATASSAMQLIYQMVEQQLQEIGIQVTLATYAEDSWLDMRKSGKLDAYISTWTMDYNDPANVMVTFFGSPENTQSRSINYPNKAVMKRVGAAGGIVEEKARMEEYQALERILIEEDVVWVPMFGNTHLFAVGSRVESFRPYWTGYSDFCARDVILK